MVAEMREVRANANCPCESGKRYGRCCKPKAFRWVVDEQGSHHKEVPLSPPAREALEQAAEHYRDVFEREAQGSDPVFLSKYLFSEEDIAKQTMEAMRVAGISPAIMYAFRRTGHIAWEGNLDLMTDRDRQAWDDAIEEYYALEEDPPEPEPVQVLFESLEEELDNCIICLGYVLEYGRSSQGEKIGSSSRFFTVDDYVLICAAKSMKTLRSIKVLLSEDIGADCLALSRHLFENYLHIVFSIAQPTYLKHLLDAPIGLKLGTHDFARSNGGKIDSRRIICKSTGEEFLGHISYFKMAERSPYKSDLNLFDYMYSFLSEYTHPSFASLGLVLGDSGELDPLSNELKSEAMFYSVCFAAMILDQLRKLPSVSSTVKIDINTVTSRIREKSVSLLDEMFAGTSPEKSFEVLRQRLMLIASG